MAPAFRSFRPARCSWFGAVGLAATAVFALPGCASDVARDDSSPATEVRPMATHAIALQIEGMT